MVDTLVVVVLVAVEVVDVVEGGPNNGVTNAGVTMASLGARAFLMIF